MSNTNNILVTLTPRQAILANRILEEAARTLSGADRESVDAAARRIHAARLRVAAKAAGLR